MLTEFGDGLDVKWEETSQDDSQVIGVSNWVSDGDWIEIAVFMAGTLSLKLQHGSLLSCMPLLKCHLCIQAFADQPTENQSLHFLFMFYFSLQRLSSSNILYIYFTLHFCFVWFCFLE